MHASVQLFAIKIQNYTSKQVPAERNSPKPLQTVQDYSKKC